MDAGPSNLAYDHLIRLKTTLRKELEDLEVNIAEFEAGQVVRQSRIEELASALHGISDDPQLISGIQDNGDGNSPETVLVEARLKLREIIDEVNREFSVPDSLAMLAETFNTSRSRLIMTINTLDLISVALRKNAELLHELDKKTEGQNSKTVLEYAVGSRAAPGSSAIIRSQELERHKIAREIHDGPAQAMANVVLRMDILSKIYEMDPSKIPDELKKMKRIAQNALDEIRGFIFDLKPMTLADLGLIATIKRIVTNLQDMDNITIRLVVDGEERDLGPFVTLTVFRIAQEALNNVRKYSGCKSAWVHLKYLHDMLVLLVEDDGVGFNLNEMEKSRNNYTSFGLLGMQERADDINAEFIIKTAPGQGTKVALIVPTRDNPALDVKWEG